MPPKTRPGRNWQTMPHPPNQMQVSAIDQLREMVPARGGISGSHAPWMIRVGTWSSELAERLGRRAPPRAAVEMHSRVDWATDSTRRWPRPHPRQLVVSGSLPGHGGPAGWRERHRRSSPVRRLRESASAPTKHPGEADRFHREWSSTGSSCGTGGALSAITCAIIPPSKRQTHGPLVQASRSPGHRRPCRRAYRAVPPDQRASCASRLPRWLSVEESPASRLSNRMT